MPDNNPDRISSYLQYLPYLQQSDKFLGHFLLAIERILSGFTPKDSDDIMPNQLGLEEYIDRIHTYFNPGLSTEESGTAPADFLPWLASWVAASLQEEWDENFQRKFISNIVPLYRLRGTKAGMKKILEIYTGEEVKIYEFDRPAHYFQVEMTLSETAENLRRKQQIAKTILDLQKPAHTFYSFQVLVPTMQIRNKDLQNGIIVGRTTILGTTSNR
ncbi:phage tail protein I [Aerosakkonema funiforme]|uniref:Phage tail protein I n=1 Tax=Aerosakkonema funiforme FACHB-1375 TaxID=2949571 RepID=A0A926ZKS2_9CYAN|nr:phage tail protein I [Aerosakkonema funiforme]MBD2184296.1 phage tail protein I [Aerosakkonema funiforme FACHB-1375]